MSVSKIQVAGKVIDLNQSNYLTGGGEGEIWQKAGVAYKIYHDPAKMIPVGKIVELNALKQDNILGPQEVVTDMKGNPIGFSMRYVNKTEYLCKLFTKSFRDSHGIAPSDINALVKRIQDTAKYIHQRQILIVDANELNFLTNKGFDECFFIDVDSYKTRSYPATALMDSIKDPLVKDNKFTIMSDFYSLAIVMFQMYLGCHPFKGRHPDYGKDWQAMQKNHVSLFNKATRPPPNIQDWSVIPAGHKKYFERVFEHGERGVPPEPDQISVTAGQVVPQIVNSTAKFNLQLTRAYDSKVERIRWIQGAAYAYTDNSVYADGRVVASHCPQTGFNAKRSRHDFVYVQSSAPVCITFNEITETLSWATLDNKTTGEFAASSYFVANDKLYVVTNGNLVEYSFMNLGAKVIAAQQIVGSVFHTHSAFDGIILQDILGKCHASIPVKAGQVNLVKIDCLNRTRIIDAKYERGTAIVLAEQEGKICRWTFHFDKEIKDFTARRQEAVPMQDVQLVVLDKGVSVATNEDNLELFFDLNKVRVVDDSPISGNQKLVSFGNDIYLLNGKELFKLTMK